MWEPQKQLKQLIKETAEEAGVSEEDVKEAIYYTFKFIRENIEELGALAKTDDDPEKLPVFHVPMLGKFIPHIGRIVCLRNKKRPTAEIRAKEAQIKKKLNDEERDTN